MNKKEVFYRFIKNGNVTPEEYNLAKIYYLEEANEEEKRLYASFFNILVPSLQKAYDKSETHLIVLARKHGISKEEALELIRDFQNSNSDGFLSQLQKQGINEEEYLKPLYLACLEFKFCKSRLIDYVSNIGINYKLFLDLVRIYLRKYLGLSNGEAIFFLNKIETTEDFYEFLSNKSGNFNNALYYSRTFATSAERTTFGNILNEIVSEFYQDDLSNEEIAKRMEARYSIPVANAKKIVSKYINKRKSNRTNEKLDKYKLACDMFLNNFSYQDISNYLKKEEISWDFLRRNYVEIYVKGFIQEDMRADVYNKIIQRMQEYIAMKEKARRRLKCKLRNEPFDEEVFWEAKKVITEMVYGSKWIPTFLKKLGEETFYRYLTLIEMYDESLYNLYLFRRNSKMASLDENIIESIVFYINNGILENGVLREFNILDYFRMVRLPIDTFINILQEYDNEVKQVIVKFLLQNKARLHPLTDTITSNVDIDEDSIVKKYLILNDLPMFDLVYMLVLENYRNGNLIIDLNSRK